MTLSMLLLASAYSVVHEAVSDGLQTRYALVSDFHKCTTHVF